MTAVSHSHAGARDRVRDCAGIYVHITGVVQGVGFRPFVYGLARRYRLTGWVRNTSAGVDIEADGPPETLAAFVQALAAEAPPLARIEAVEVTERPFNGFTQFEIHHSAPIPGAFQPISPDVSLCPDCRRELFDPADRRYQYPFINCTNCGPRFTIIRDIPYDRPQTTMGGFPLCPDCAAEYEEPLDRRFHAQPVACPVCGPHVWLEGGGELDGRSPIDATRQLLAAGQIVAVKGLGGFHLACDATNETAVAELRRRKLRVEKPFAVMLPDLAAVEQHCVVSPAERAQLASVERPIIILPRRPTSTIVAAVAPGQATIGVMLPYTPLHELLLAAAPYAALVMTSGNLSEEPIAAGNDEARDRLGGLADALLLHNRDIHIRCDDSVLRLWMPAARGEGDGQPLAIRRARGYAPAPIRLPHAAPPLLATGAELKNTFCLARDRSAFLSQHIGDLSNYEMLQAFEAGVAHFERLFRVRPERIVYDLHPDYLATRYALARAEQEGVTAVGVQHHHAHIAACLAEHGHPGDRPVIGVSFDGTGYGDDGAIWGGEFLLADYRGYHRAAHLAYVPLPGGDKAIREPWRQAVAWLHQLGQPWDEALPPVRYALAAADLAISPLELVRQQLARGLNAPPTSSMGRLFDAVAALAGVRQVVNYEAQAAIELEALIDRGETAVYPFGLAEQVVDPGPLLLAVLADVRQGVAAGRIAARFHHGVAAMVEAVCRRLRAAHGLDEVALSGGVWQNVTLLRAAVARLEKAGFTVFYHRQIPPNDGGLALGQVMVGREY